MPQSASRRFWRGLKTRIGGLFVRTFYFPRIRNCEVYCAGTIRLGRHSIICGGVIIVDPGATLEIADNVYVGHYCNIRVRKPVAIGSGCKIAQFVTIVDHDYDFRAPQWQSGFVADEIEIGNDCFIGAGTTVLRGSRIPARTIVPAHTVINRGHRAVGESVPYGRLRIADGT